MTIAPRCITPNNGFTLIEISIVMVVIGLIVGGILVGRNLIETAQLKSLMSQVEKYKAAVLTFQMKYNALPGDMSNATNYWPQDPLTCNQNYAGTIGYTCNGDGDGHIGASSSNDPNFGSVFHETFLAWNHLSLAHLIEDPFPATGPYAQIYGSPGYNIPMMANTKNPAYGIELMYSFTGMIGNNGQGTAGSHVFVLGMQPPMNTLFGAGSGTYGGRALTPNQAHYIDSKMDDGNPYSGAITGTWDYWTDSCGTSNSGQSTGANAYLAQDALVQGYPSTPQGCALFIDAGF